MMTQTTTYKLSLEDLRQVTIALAKRLRFRDMMTCLITDDDFLDLLLEAVQEVKET
jgi:hypothetical protein